MEEVLTEQFLWHIFINWILIQTNVNMMNMCYDGQAKTIKKNWQYVKLFIHHFVCINIDESHIINIITMCWNSIFSQISISSCFYQHF